MLIPRNALCENDRQGCQGVNLAKLRSALADPSRLTEPQRQRLIELERKLDRVRALGDEYAGIGLSEQAMEAVRTARAVG